MSFHSNVHDVNNFGADNVGLEQHWLFKVKITVEHGGIWGFRWMKINVRNAMYSFTRTKMHRWKKCRRQRPDEARGKMCIIAIIIKGI
jgi:hypothetical protein